MSKVFEGKRLYITLNVIMLIITLLSLLILPLSWVGFLISCLYTLALKFILPAAVITNTAAFCLATQNKFAAAGAAAGFGFIGGLIGSFVTSDEELSKTLRVIFIVMLWVTAISPAANILLHQLDVLPMLM